MWEFPFITEIAGKIAVVVVVAATAAVVVFLFF